MNYPTLLFPVGAIQLPKFSLLKSTGLLDLSAYVDRRRHISIFSWICLKDCIYHHIILHLLMHLIYWWQWNHICSHLPSRFPEEVETDGFPLCLPDPYRLISANQFTLFLSSTSNSLTTKAIMQPRKKELQSANLCLKSLDVLHHMARQ